MNEMSLQGVAPVQVRYADGEFEQLGMDLCHFFLANIVLECIYEYLVNCLYT